MSDLALSDSGERKTASEFHDDYMMHGVEYQSFVCPFCFIGLVAKAIYIDGPQGISPHFSCFPKKPHINGCDGYPLIDGKTVKESKVSNKIKIGKDEFSFPEKLVSRSKPSQNKFIDDFSRLVENNDPEKVKERRDKAGRELGSAKYTSSIIRSFASSKKAIISLVYKYAKEEGLADGDRRTLLKESLSKAPIELDGYKTNYQVAFQGTKYFSKYKKIWNGSGVVKIKGNFIYILSDQHTEYSENDHRHELNFYVAVRIPGDLEASPAYHKTIVERLVKAREKELAVKWHSYGMAKLVLDKDSVLLGVDNLDHVFIEKI